MSFYSKYSANKPCIFSLNLDFSENLPVLNADDIFYDFIEYSKEEFENLLNNRFLYLLHPADIIHLNEIIFSENSFDGKELNLNCALITKNKASKFIRLAIRYQVPLNSPRTLTATIFDNSSEVDNFTLPSLLDVHFNFLNDLTDSYYFHLDLLTNSFTSTEKFAKLISMPASSFIFPNDLIDNHMLTKEYAKEIFSSELKGNQLYYQELHLKTSLNEKIFLMRYKAYFNHSNQPIHIAGRLTDITKQTLDLNSISDGVKFDNLTLLYNKNIAFDLIKKLLLEKDQSETSALILIDLKGFKSVNENFGVIFGDAILSEYANLLKKTFRNIDIVSRIGGDDFLIFMQDYHSDTLVRQKVKKIHKLFAKSHLSNQKHIEITAEIGIAVSSKDSNLKTLLNKASLALKNTKNSNQTNFFTIYKDDLEGHTFESHLSKINEHNSLQQNFSEHIASYVFNLLYNSHDFQGAIQSVLHLITNHFNFTSSVITEFSDDSRFLNSSYYWSQDKDITHIFKNTPVTDFLFLTVPIVNSGSLILDSHSETDKNIMHLLKSNNIRSLISFSLIDDGKSIGFITFTSNEAIKTFTDKQLKKLEGAAKIISVFLSKHNAKNINYQNFVDNIKS